MDFEFPPTDTTAHEGTTLLLNDGVKEFKVRWKVQPKRHNLHATCEEGYYCIFCCTDICGIRRSTGIPWNVEEMASVYKSHELAIYIPEDPYAQAAA
jgi:hypothetical protein